MSNTIQSKNAIERALKFNKGSKFASQPLPQAAIVSFPGLSHEDKGGVEFYAAVVAVQAYFGFNTDGMFGSQTYHAVIATWGGASNVEYIVHEGIRVPIETAGLFILQDFTEQSEFDLHRFGHFSKRKQPVDRVVLHHGGFNVVHLAAVLSDADRKVSTHFGVGLPADKNSPIIIGQYLDTKWNAYHCGPFNEGSVGVDFAVQPGAEYADRYKLPVIDNPSTIGPRKVLQLPDNLLQAMVQFLEQLHIALNIDKPMKLAPSTDMKLDRKAIAQQDITVHGHHHVATNGKWDVAYIWDRLLQLTTR